MSGKPTLMESYTTDKAYSCLLYTSDDVIPSSAGGAFTAVGRIVNSAPNIYGNYGFYQANYGLFIDVTGGTKNYGISGNCLLYTSTVARADRRI